ncbi:hypothetical protein [Deinococcus cellulosilyticus]|uniref:Uncharacterized protein n=1 Tax=Deinococcus cellulosilyticus (strain DSM 18568 / NBRC 106333 / KACC 11606 / 5516J-15) TaxID=1223518 RepID=A0A511N3M2_DEIC1|nr:hypothetical protein [Deinococcus cellulosilyticus]GEM47432.1 hypothetical protein DC3_30670 [Deinococcus cellulosilyticus NBRC 106333 = KACC 11606]
MRAYLKSFWMWSIPIAWLLLEHLTMRTRVRLEVPFLAGGQTTVSFYGFPLPFQHYSMISSKTFNVYLLPFALDLLVYLVVVGLLTYPLRHWISRIYEPYRYGIFLFLWAWVLWTVFVNHSLDHLALTPKYQILQVMDQEFYIGVPRGH